MAKPLVYVAAPYTSPDPVWNTHAVAKLGTKMVEDGLVTPILPHLSLLWHVIEPRPIEFWYDYDLEVMARCDSLLRVPGPSSGADNEVEAAGVLGLPVFFTYADLKGWARDVWGSR